MIANLFVCVCVLFTDCALNPRTEMHGRGFDVYNLGSAGNGDGAGGGWRKESTGSNQTGQSLLSGAHGGLPCKRLAKWLVLESCPLTVATFIATNVASV